MNEKETASWLLLFYTGLLRGKGNYGERPNGIVPNLKRTN